MGFTLADTDLFQTLESKCGQKGATPFDGTELVVTVTKATRAMRDVLNRACTNFEEYSTPSVS
jgi:hypothetical protein